MHVLSVPSTLEPVHKYLLLWLRNLERHSFGSLTKCVDKWIDIPTETARIHNGPPPQTTWKMFVYILGCNLLTPYTINLLWEIKIIHIALYVSYKFGTHLQAWQTWVASVGDESSHIHFPMASGSCFRAQWFHGGVRVQEYPPMSQKAAFASSVIPSSPARGRNHYHTTCDT